jgi:DNA-binding winged helix-turn-helix (wHTH) protein/TolB-like protein/Tfp pilus assembly protein PilF
MGEQQEFEFGPYRLEPSARRLLRNGEPVSLTPKAFDILVALVERPDRVVEKAELMKLVWPDSFVEEANLSQTIFVLRKTLGDAPDGRPYIDTVPRRGYRFAGGKPLDSPSQVTPPPARPRMMPWVAAGATLAVLVALGATAFILSWSSTPERIESLVVLPFGDLSKQAGSDTLAESITDALITKLGQIGGLRVISRTSAMTYRDTNKTVPQIARELNVDAVVEGTVQRVGEQVRLNLKLIHAPTDRTMWAQSYEQDVQHALDLHNEMARAIVGRTSVALTEPERARLAATTRVTPKVYEAYLKGRYFWTRRSEPDMQQAIANFEEAIRLDNGYAPAHAGLADSYAIYGSYGWKLPGGQPWVRAVAAAEKAIALDPELADGHTSRARIALNHELDWERTGAGYRRALELNPGYANAHHWYGYYLLLTGRLDEGEKEIRRALELDPLSPIFNANAGMAAYFGRRYDAAIAHWQKALEMHRNYPLLHAYLATAYCGKGMYAEAVAELEKGATISGAASMDLGLLAHTYGRMGRVKEARALVAKLSPDGDLVAYDLARAYLGIGDTDRMFEWLARSVDTRMGAFNELNADPIFDPVRADPRFAELLKRMRFPAVAAGTGV